MNYSNPSNPQHVHDVAVPVNAKKVALVNGVIWGVISIVLFLVIYYAAPQLIGNMAYGVFTILLSIALGVYFVLDLRKKIGGYWNFKEALSHIFLLFFVQYIVMYVFMLVFPKIEPEYNDIVRSASLNAVTEMAETLGASDQDAIDEMIAEAEKAVDQQLNPTISTIFQGLAISVIMYFVGALIFAAIFKRERPVFEPVAFDE
jgi:uncharacterized membrane protein YjfL (UPF0719 family)